MMKWMLPILTAIVLLATAAVYLPSLQGQFVSMDDESYVVTNRHIRTLDGGTVAWAFASVFMYNYHPLTMLSYAVDHAIWGLDPFGYHLTNLLLHLANVVLVMMLAARLTASAGTDAEGSLRVRVPIIAMTTGLLFAIHPLRVESVAWVSERKDVLFGFFYLLSIMAYVRYTAAAAGKGRSVPYILSLLCFLLSALSKPMAVSLPIVLLLLDIFPLKRLSAGGTMRTAGKLVFEKAPFLLVSLVIGVATIAAQGTSGEVRTFADLSFGERLLVASRALWFYLVKFLWPASLAPFYPLAVPVRFAASDAAGLLFLGALTAWSVQRWRRGEQLWLAAWSFYIITLLPTLGFVQVGGQAAADRYTYLPLLGPAFLAAAGTASLGAWLGQMPKWRVPLMAAAVLAALVVCSALAVASYRQIGIWRDSVSLWSREIAVFPFEASISYHARGKAYARAGDLARAEADFSLAVQLDPADYRSWSSRGMVRSAQGRGAAACGDLRQALAIKPDYHEALYYARSLCR